jgi:hypothetical protein
MAPASREACDLSWIGMRENDIGGRCSSVFEHGCPVQGGTSVAVGRRHAAPGEALDDVYIMEGYEPLIDRVIGRLTGHPYREVMRTPLRASPRPDFAAMTDPWNLKPPLRTNGKRFVFATQSPDHPDTSVHLLSVAFASFQQVPTGQASVAAELSIAGIAGGKIALKAGREHISESSLVAALDPVIELSVMSPGQGRDQSLREYLEKYLFEVGDEAGVPDLLEAFFSAYRDVLRDGSDEGLRLALSPQTVALDAGDRATISLAARWDRPGGRTLIAVRLRNLSTWQSAVSDLIEVECIA